MLLHCVRHGESVFNAEGRLQGHLDVPLSDRGRRQSAAAAEALAGSAIERVFASPLRRARETAEVIAARLGLAITFDDRLKEINVGVFQGTRREDLATLFPEECARWKSGDPEYAIPGGESRADLMRRGRAVFTWIAESGLSEAAIVAHGRLIVVTLRALLPGVRKVWAISGVENGSITTLTLKADGCAELLALNRVDHLAGIGLSGKGDL